MDLISVILSAYNEPIGMIQKSVESILNQTYTNMEIILINDNPDYPELDPLFQNYRDADSRVTYIYHAENKGLVYSLNEGIKCASGDYIARMDADDISAPDRLEKQLSFLKANHYDMVGCNIMKIDEDEKPLGELKVPSHFEGVKKYQKYGNCVLHPTWLVKREVYERLDGYRRIYACEDYDFVLRAIQSGFKLGNLPENKLFYRIRSNSISVSSSVKQKLTMYFLIKNGLYHKEVPVEALDEYLHSAAYEKDVSKLEEYKSIKSGIAQKHAAGILPCWKVLCNKYFYRNVMEHLKAKERAKYSE